MVWFLTVLELLIKNIVEQNYNKALSDAQAAKGASPSIYQTALNNLTSARTELDNVYSTSKTYKTPRTISDQNKYLGRTFTDRTTGLQKVTSKAKAATTKVANAIKMAASAILPGAGLVVSGLQAIAPKETAVQKVNKGYFNTNEGSQRISGNPATDLYAGMNRTSDFGNLEKAGNKRVATREKIARREKSGKPMSDKFKCRY